jgi:hypothetical protein
MTYADKLKDPRWQKKRLEIYQRDDFECQRCFDKGSTLVVHHKWYTKGDDPWSYPDTCYITLCEDCHNIFHSRFENKYKSPDYNSYTMNGVNYTDIFLFETYVNKILDMRQESGILKAMGSLLSIIKDWNKNV